MKLVGIEIKITDNDIDNVIGLDLMLSTVVNLGIDHSTLHIDIAKNRNDVRPINHYESYCSQKRLLVKIKEDIR